MKSILASSLALFLAVDAHALEVPKHFERISDGVYEGVDSDGALTRLSFGQAGASYERSLLELKLEQFANKHTLSEAESREFERIHEALSGMPKASSVPTTPAASNFGGMCDVLDYAFDSHFAVGLGGASPLVRVSYAYSLFGPLPVIASFTQHASASVTPSGSATITDSHTDSSAGIVPIAQVNWRTTLLAPVSSASCSASTYAYVSVTTDGPPCNKAPGFASQTKTYSTCVGSL